jgi:hypothetical protein
MDQVSTDPIFQSLPQAHPSPKGAKEKSTDIFLTLNINEYFAHMSPEQKVKFRDFCIDLFDKKRILTYLVDRFSPSNPLANVESVDIRWRVEVGPKSQKLHVHSLIAINHTGFLTFRANDLREEARKIFGHHIYLSSPISSNERTRYANYINKGFQQAEINK